MMKYTFMPIRSVYIAFWKQSLLTFVLFFLAASVGFAMDVTLQWDANNESDRDGYKIYYATASGAPYDGKGATEGDSPIDVKIADVETGDTAGFTLTGLNEDTDYYFVLTAYNKRGWESGYSVEVSTAEGVNAASTDEGGGGGCFISTIMFEK